MDAFHIPLVSSASWMYTAAHLALSPSWTWAPVLRLHLHPSLLFPQTGAPAQLWLSAMPCHLHLTLLILGKQSWAIPREESTACTGEIFGSLAL